MCIINCKRNAIQCELIALLIMCFKIYETINSILIPVMTEKTETRFQLSSPPAMEVILGVEVEDDNQFSYKKLEITEHSFKSRFPTQAKLSEISGTFDTEKEELQQSHFRNIGYEYKSDEEASNFRINGFTYNKLGNYPGGEKFLQSALEVWNVYAQKREKFKVKKLGLRYINVITVENFTYNYEDFFNFFLHTPDHKKIQNILYRYSTSFEEQNCDVTVNFLLDSVRSNLEAKFIFDIDVIKKDVPATLTKEYIEKYFKEMRLCKNEIFFSTLKNNVLEGYR